MRPSSGSKSSDSRPSGDITERTFSNTARASSARPTSDSACASQNVQIMNATCGEPKPSSTS